MTNPRPSLISARLHRVNRVRTAHHEYWLRRPIEFGFRSDDAEVVAECTELRLTGRGADREEALQVAFSELERIWQQKAETPTGRRLHALVARVDPTGSTAAAT